MQDALIDPTRLSKAQRVRLSEIGTFKHIRARNGYRIPGQFSTISLQTIEKLEELGLVRQISRGKGTVVLTGAGRNLVDVINQRELQRRRAAALS